MKSLEFSRYALSMGVAAAMLAGCGGSPSPIGGPGAMPQTSAIAARAKPLSATDLIYVGVQTGTKILTYPEGKVVASFASYGPMCSNLNSGDVFIVGYSTIGKYSHGGTQPLSTLTAPSGFSFLSSCAVETATGDLAAAVFDGKTSETAIYASAQGTPVLFSDANVVTFDRLTYDASGNLFALCEGRQTPHLLTELPQGTALFTDIDIKLRGLVIGSLQWDGSNITVGKVPGKILRIQVRGSRGKIVSVTNILNASGKPDRSGALYTLYDSQVVAPIGGARGKTLGIWNYPGGGVPSTVINGLVSMKHQAVTYTTISPGSER